MSFTPDPRAVDSSFWLLAITGRGTIRRANPFCCCGRENEANGGHGSGAYIPVFRVAWLININFGSCGVTFYFFSFFSISWSIVLETCAHIFGVANVLRLISRILLFLHVLHVSEIPRCKKMDREGAGLS